MHVLWVEDNPDDIDITLEAIKQCKVLFDLTVVRNGVEAMSYLRKEGRFSLASCPDIIILDLNLPKKNGREVLKETKTDNLLKHIPVIIFTTSKDKRDVFHAYNLHANGYISKPVEMTQFMKIIKSLDAFWGETVTFSTAQEGANHIETTHH